MYSKRSKGRVFAWPVAAVCLLLTIATARLSYDHYLLRDLRPEHLLLWILVTVVMAAAAVSLLWVTRRSNELVVSPQVMQQLVRLEQQSSDRMAAQLHDTAVQSLIVASLLAEHDPELAEQLHVAEREMRDLIVDADTTAVRDRGLNAACDDLRRRLDLREGLDIRWECTISPDTPIAEVTADLVYRFLQETLTNAAKHSGSASAQVSCSTNANDIVITVRDAGTGFANAKEVAARPAGGLGLLLARATCLGASVTIDSCPDEGTEVTLRAPLPTDLALNLVRMDGQVWNPQNPITAPQPVLREVSRRLFHRSPALAAH